MYKVKIQLFYFKLTLIFIMTFESKTSQTFIKFQLFLLKLQVFTAENQVSVILYRLAGMSDMLSRLIYFNKLKK